MYRAEPLRPLLSKLKRGKPLKCIVWIESKDCRYLEKFYDIDPSLAAFKAGDERLILA